MSNRLRLFAIALLALLFVPASAMQQSDLPPRFNIPWGNSSVAPYIRNIPQASQIGVQNCAASLTDGFPPLTFVPASAGGCPPFGADFNGVLKQITQWSRWQAAGGPVFYDATLSTAIGGYPKGATVQSSVLVGRIWFSTADNNTTSPDAPTSANWIALPGTASAGTPVPSFSTTAPANTVSANGLTVGNATSNATSRANADTFWLFSFIWTNCPNTQCQLFNSSGGTISRGGSAAIDYAANNAIATYNMNGAAMMGADSQSGTTSSNLVNVPVVTGSRTVPGSVLGENLHQLTSTEVPPTTFSGTTGTESASHNHNYIFPVDSGARVSGTGNLLLPAISSTVTGGENSTHTHAFSGAINGGNGSHNTVARSFITYWNLAL